MNFGELEIKTQRLVSVLDRQNYGAVILNGQHNFAWLTGGGSSGIDLSRENGSVSLLITRNGKRYLIANNIEMPRMRAEEVSLDDFEPLEISWQDEKADGNTALHIAKNTAGGEIVTDIPLFGGTRAIDSELAPCRYELTVDEIERYRSLGRDTGSSVGRVILSVSPGETETAIAQKINAELGTLNIRSIVTLVAADDRIAKYRHPIPTDKIWRKTLLVVTCAKRFGLIVSLSRVICVGGVDDELLQKTDAAAFVNAAIMDATKPEISGADLYNVAAKAYADAGFTGEIGLHHQGGATGYKTRDWVAHPKSAEFVRSDQAFAWNPSITGTKVEETVIVNGDGVETITKTPNFPQILTKLNGFEYFSPGVLSI